MSLKRAREFPTDKDWYVELYKELGLEHKLPNYNLINIQSNLLGIRC